jgi:hypothetical protein
MRRGSKSLRCSGFVAVATSNKSPNEIAVATLGLAEKTIESPSSNLPKKVYISSIVACTVIQNLRAVEFEIPQIEGFHRHCECRSDEKE